MFWQDFFIGILNVPKLKLFNEDIDHVDRCSYLGITLDNKLHMQVHMNNVKNQVLFKTYMLGKIRKFLNLEASVLVFKSMLLPFLNLGTYFWKFVMINVKKN